MVKRSRRPPIPVADLLGPYNPWWLGGGMGRAQPEAFRRPVFERLLDDFLQLRQILSITGPRRVGKTTLVRQLIEELLRRGTDARRIVYFSLDDPLLLEEPYRDSFFDLLVEWLGHASGAPRGDTYLFLDEVQRYARWELYLKKLYDLKYPIRFVVSGSASSPIFKKSRESLLGRVKDFHVLPFSFREFTLFRWQGSAGKLAFLDRLHQAGAGLRNALLDTPPEASWTVSASAASDIHEAELRELLDDYLVEGGFPETWELPDLLRKQEYLFENQVQKVIFEDLVLATEFRKPENIKTFYLSLIEQPGRELNLERAASELGVSRPMLEKYFPMLEMTDLVHRLPKFSRRAMKLRRGNVKCYLVDLALRNAVLKLGSRVLDQPETLGYYAENLVFGVLSRWPEAVQLSYFREQGVEVDFVVSLAGRTHLPVEVKFRGSRAGSSGLVSFLDRMEQGKGILVTEAQVASTDPRVIAIPLHHFLVAFD
jgi:predicted AAA+ superfamily ATPase